MSENPRPDDHAGKPETLVVLTWEFNFKETAETDDFLSKLRSGETPESPQVFFEKLMRFASASGKKMTFRAEVIYRLADIDLMEGRGEIEP